MPLSKLFHKRPSVKDKNSKPSDLQVNKATSESRELANKDNQSSCMSSASSEHLPLPTEHESDVLLENKEVTAPSDQLSPPKTETVRDVTCNSVSEENSNNDLTLVDQSLLKAESIQDASTKCMNDDVRKEDSMSTEQLPEVVMRVSPEVISEKSTPNEQLTSKSENIQDDFFENKDSMVSEDLPSKTETLDTIPRGFNNEVKNVDPSSDQVSKIGEDINDVKTAGIRSEGCLPDELMLLKDENMESSQCDFSNKDAESESCQSVELLKTKDELYPNSKESDDASEHIINLENGNSCSFPKEDGDLQTKKDSVKSTKSSNRSSSFRESGTKQDPPKSRRRKCESESAASNSTDDEGFDDKVMRFGVTDLEKMIGQCVNRLIRESIATAVRSVDVDSLCDEVLKSISDRSQSESSTETVEQRVHTNSVKEYVDLEMLDTFEDEESNCEAEEATDDVELHAIDMTHNQEKNSEGDGCFVEDANNSSTVEELIDTSGYHADCEESSSVNSITLETGKTPSENIIPVGVTSSEGNNEIGQGSSFLKLNESVDSSPKQDNEEITKIDAINETVDNSLNKNEEEVTTSNASIDNENSSLKNDAEVELKSDITTEIMDDVQKKVLEDVNRSDITNEIVESTLKHDPEEESHKGRGMLRVESEDLISMSDDAVPEHLGESDQTQDDAEEPPDLDANLPQHSQATDEEKKVKWKAGYLHVKLPHKSRGKGHLKAWKKRCVSIQPDEFAHSNPCLIVTVFSGSDRKKGAASFWKSVSGQKAVVYRSSSSTQRYAFTVAEANTPVVHLAADSEADAQGWMAAMRAVLWPPSPVVELEKMLNGSQFEVSLIDNDFSYRAGLLGMYGHLTITQKKLILVHPQQGYVIQEWYLNTVDKFELTHQTRIEDVHKVLCMTTCSDSSTGKGEILIFCREAVALLQSLASTIHKILTYHSKQEGGKYQKELEEIAEWLVPSASSNAAEAEEYYKVPPRQVRSLLDIPNFIFDKPLTPVASVACTSGLSMESATNKPLSEVSKTNPSRASQDSGISAGAQSAEDFLNCSHTSFVVGGGAFHAGKSSDSELSDSYTPPLSPSVKVRHLKEGLKTEGDA